MSIIYVGLHLRSTKTTFVEKDMTYFRERTNAVRTHYYMINTHGDDVANVPWIGARSGGALQGASRGASACYLGLVAAAPRTRDIEEVSPCELSSARKSGGGAGGRSAHAPRARQQPCNRSGEAHPPTL